MTDENYLYVSDIADKKRTARGSHNKRTHCGKGGAVRFPSDYLSRKEFIAMSGEVKAYRLNDPMKWDEFNALPDDVKELYIKSLRNRFRVSDVKIFEMLGITQSKGSVSFRKLGLALGRGSGMHTDFKKEEWFKWLNGIKSELVDDVCEVPNPVAENRGGEKDMEKTEEKKEGCLLSQRDVEIIQREFGRIEGLACGCETIIRKALCKAVKRIEVVLNIEEGGAEDG